jgi:KDO2-lipid IV(A) lauroyltransferase
LAREVFRRTGANMLSSLRTSRIDASELRRSVVFANPEVLPGPDDPRGVAVVLAHMGNWEALAQCFPLFVPAGHKGGTIYRFLNNPIMDEHLQAARRRSGVQLFEKRSSPMAMAGFVRSGGWLGILSDQRVETAGEIVPFFGRLTSCTPLPALLARRTGAVVIGLSVRTAGCARWVIKAHPLQGEATTENCMRLLEEIMRESPEDVFWMQDRWRVNPKRPLEMAGRAPSADGERRAGKARRGVVWERTDAEASAPPKGGYGVIRWERYSPPRPRLTVEEVTTELLRLDASEALPLDYVYLPEHETAVRKACRRLGLAVVVTGENREVEK